MSEKSNCQNGKSTKCSDKDTMVVLNGAVAGVAALAGPAIEGLDLPDDLKKIVYVIVNGLFNTERFKEELFKEASVAELAFDGYETGLLTVLNNLDEAVIEIVGLLQEGAKPDNINAALEWLQGLLALFDLDVNVTETYYELKAIITNLVNTTPQISDGRFGIFKGKNATKADSYYAINTGLHEHHNFLKILEVNGKERLPENWWPNVAPTPTGQDAGVAGICHDIIGTDGSQFPPFVDQKQRLWIYVAEMCRWYINILGLFFFIFSFNAVERKNLINLHYGWWLDSNCGPRLSEETALPDGPQPRCTWFKFWRDPHCVPFKQCYF